MKKSVLTLTLIFALFISGCANKTPQTSPDDLPHYDISRADDYIASVEEQSDILRSYLAHGAVTQTDLNMKSQELYELWDEALGYFMNELKFVLSQEDFASLQDEQLIWAANKEAALEEAGKEFAGGSVYPLVVNSEGAKLTEERVYELYELLKTTTG